MHELAAMTMLIGGEAYSEPLSTQLAGTEGEGVDPEVVSKLEEAGSILNSVAGRELSPEQREAEAIAEAEVLGPQAPHVIDIPAVEAAQEALSAPSAAPAAKPATRTRKRPKPAAEPVEAAEEPETEEEPEEQDADAPDWGNF